MARTKKTGTSSNRSPGNGESVATQRKFQEIGEELVQKDRTTWDKDTFDRLYRMIDYAIKRQDWYEDQRNKILSLAIGLLGLSSFLVAGLLGSHIAEMYFFRFFGGMTLLSIVVSSFLVIFEYARGARENYTHRRLADIRSWYSPMSLPTP